jgi:RimJ/RimL family protein N-acetyltransferase
MRLAPYTDADLALTRELETDPAVMAELGGPRDPEEIPRIHRRRMASVGEGDWWLTIHPDDGAAAGAIGVWPTRWRGETIYETGWMVLPRFQGRGIAGAALAELIARVRVDDRFEALHAFPAMTNPASNALCRRAGFAVVEEGVEIAYSGRPLVVRHWALDV